MYDRLFHDGNIIMLDNDTRKTGIIKYIGVDDEEGGTVELKGFSLLHMLTQRITVPPKGKAHHEFNKAAAEDIMTALVNTNAVAPADSKRKIPKLVINKAPAGVTG
ncbi:phage-like protein [Blautia producta]|nr:phage-like protein [Blautia coccoides]